MTLLFSLIQLLVVGLIIFIVSKTGKSKSAGPANRFTGPAYIFTATVRLKKSEAHPLYYHNPISNLHRYWYDYIDHEGKLQHKTILMRRNIFDDTLYQMVMWQTKIGDSRSNAVLYTGSNQEYYKKFANGLFVADCNNVVKRLMQLEDNKELRAQFSRQTPPPIPQN